jgi:hypothetical protein
MKHQGPQGVRQSLKRSGRTWSAIGRRIYLKSAKQNMKSFVKKLRVTLKRTLGAPRRRMLPVTHVPTAEANMSRGLEALVLAQSDLPTTGANLAIKWEQIVVEGKSDAFVCCTCMLECCVVSSVVLRAFDSIDSTSIVVCCLLDNEFVSACLIILYFATSFPISSSIAIY